MFNPLSMLSRAGSFGGAQVGRATQSGDAPMKSEGSGGLGGIFGGSKRGGLMGGGGPLKMIFSLFSGLFGGLLGGSHGSGGLGGGLLGGLLGRGGPFGGKGASASSFDAMSGAGSLAPSKFTSSAPAATPPSTASVVATPTASASSSADTSAPAVTTSVATAPAATGTGGLVDQLMAKYDGDVSGGFNKTELKSVLAQLQPNQSSMMRDLYAGMAISRYDANKDGQLNRSEAIATAEALKASGQTLPASI